MSRVPGTLGVGANRHDGLTIRRATVADAGVIGRHRVCMFTDMGEVTDGITANELLQASTQALRDYIENGTYVGWLVEDTAGQVIAGGGVHIKPQLPRPLPDKSGVATGEVPLVVNVYTEPAWRRRGLARWVTTTILEWARNTGVDRVTLHASSHGRHLYEALGFRPTNEMRWEPRQPQKSKPS